MTKEEITNIIESKELAIIEFYAKWCPPCRMLGIIIEEFLEIHPDVKFYHIDSNLDKDVAIAYNAIAVPVLLLVNNGEIIDRHDGFLEVEDLEKWYSEALTQKN